MLCPRQLDIWLLSLGDAELGHDTAAVDPDVFAADPALTELPDMQEPVGDPPAVAGDAEKGPGHRAGPNVLDHAEVITVIAVDRLHFLGVNLLSKVVVEVLSAILAMHRAVRKPHHVVLDVVRVDGNRSGRVGSLFRR